MAVTEWTAIGHGMVTGSPHPMPGLVVNGGTANAPTPETGRGYPR